MKRVLVLAGEHVCSQLRETLETDGVGYECASSQSTVLGREPHGYDLLLLGAMSPESPWSEVLQSLRDLLRQGLELPVALVTLHCNAEDAVAGIRAGACDVLVLPATPARLSEAILECTQHAARIAGSEMAAHYANLVQHLPVVVFTISLDYQLEFINETCREMLGFAPEEALQQPDWLLSRIPGEERQRMEDYFRDTFARCQTMEPVVFSFRHKHGYRLQLKLETIAMDVERGGVCPMLVEGVLSDVTERMFLDKILLQKEKLNTLAVLSDELAHEMRNPLMALGGHAQLLSRRHPEIEEAGVILQEARNLESLLNRIREYLAPQHVQQQEVDINTVLSFCSERLTSRMPGLKLHCNLDLDPDIRPVSTDPELLSEALVGLMRSVNTNAKGPGEVFVRNYETPHNVDVVFDIRPPISGMRNPESMINPFEKEGLSLSLAVAYKNVKDLGGHLAVRSMQQSTEVTLSLPKQGAGQNTAPRN